MHFMSLLLVLLQVKLADERPGQAVEPKKAPYLINQIAMIQEKCRRCSLF